MQQGNSLHQILKKETLQYSGHVAFRGSLLPRSIYFPLRMIRYLFDKTHHRFCSSSYFEVGYQVLRFFASNRFNNRIDENKITGYRQ